MKPPRDAIYLYPVETRALERPQNATPAVLANLRLIGAI